MKRTGLSVAVILAALLMLIVPAGVFAEHSAALADSVKYISDLSWIGSVTNNGSEVARDGSYKYPGQGLSVAGIYQYNKGIGMHPGNTYDKSKSTESYVELDISGYRCDTFYAFVGLKEMTPESDGTYCLVYGDYGDGNGYKELAKSHLLDLSETEELEVDISGVKKLRLVTLEGDNKNIGYDATNWGDAMIYIKDTNPPQTEPPVSETAAPDTSSAPDTSAVPVTSASPEATGKTPEGTTAGDTSSADAQEGKKTDINAIVITVACVAVVAGVAVVLVLKLGKKKK